MRDRAQAALLFLTTAVAAWVQFLYPLSSDDIFTLRVCQLPWGQLLDALRMDVHPPLYFVLTKCWLALFGATETALQAFSACTFLGAVAFVWWGSAEEDRVAATVLLNPLGLLSTRLARMYALLLLLALLAVWCEKNQAWKRLGVLHFLGTFTHIWYFFFAAGQLLMAFCWRRKPLTQTLVLSLGALPYTVFWLPVLLGQLERSKEAAAWLVQPTLADLGSAVLLLSGFSLLNLVFLAAWPRWNYVAQFAFTLLLPFALSFLKPIFYGRFTIPALAPLAFAFPFQRWPAIAGHCLLALAFSAYEWQRPKPCDSRATAEYLRGVLQAGDGVLFTSLSRAPVLHYWPEGASRSASFPAEIDQHPGYEPNYERLPGMPAVQASARRLWVLSGFRDDVSQRLQKDLEAQGYRGQLMKECPAVECYYRSVFLFTRGQ